MTEASESPDVDDYLEAFDGTKREPPKRPGVYAFYLADTGEPLYVGQASNVYQRLLDHIVIRPSDGELRERIDRDPGLDVPVDGGELWYQLEWKWVEIEDATARRDVEAALEESLKPRYPTS